MDAQEILEMADERFERRLTEESAAIRQDMTALRQEMTAGFSRLEHQIAESRVDIIKWSFLFWTSQCFVIIGFFLVFLRTR